MGVGKVVVFCFFFFFQAEDGIRYYKVTGVQTFALPISATPRLDRWRRRAEHPANRANPGPGSWLPAAVRWAPDPRAGSAAHPARAAARNLPAGTDGWRVPARCGPRVRRAGWRSPV